MVEGGLTPLEGIAAATRGSARALGLPDVGTVSAGAVADLLVVDGDPLGDPNLLRDPERIWMVVQAGHVVAGRGGRAGVSEPAPAS
jgi:imidazolonepropionase-like amidohydrolase